MKQDTLEGRAKTKNGVKRLCFSAVCILLEAAFIIAMITKLNQYAEIINLMTRLLAGVLVLKLYASDQTSSMKMPWVILILVFPILGVGLYLLPPIRSIRIQMLFIMMRQLKGWRLS